VAGESSYVERAPTPSLAAFASSVWIQQVGDRPVAQRHAPHGGAEVRCVLGEAPRLLGPLTASTYREIPAGGTVVGVRLRPGALSGLVGMPADELVDQDVAGSDIWRDLTRVTDLLGDAATPRAALDRLQSFVARSAGELDPVVNEAVRNLMPGAAAERPLCLLCCRSPNASCGAGAGQRSASARRSCTASCASRASSPESRRRSTGRTHRTSISHAGPSRPDTTTRHTSAASAAGSWA
jgi:hypothetical protein